MGCCSKDSKGDQNLNTSITFECPKCQSKGVKVKYITPQALLKECCKDKLNPNSTYKYCKNSECNIVYFSEDRNVFFIKDELTVKATLKDKGLDVNTCYCFGITRDDILNEIKETGDSNAVETIKAKMKDPGCFCETSNPQGGCCLANNMAWVKEAKKIAQNS
ncbi:MAG: copper chaperone Copz family protein [Bdellovibrionales bacterium]|jgi:hypothetical protein|nr:copper chaperone Copz family protein [Bdellovibrionales bacterium]